jgi:membrane associated rhomboid family serine protease
MIVSVNVLVFILSTILFIVNPEFIRYLAIQPSSIMQGQYLWTIVTSIFVHGGFFHLLINMFVLFSMGGLCERIIGRKRFFWFYLLSGIIAGMMFVLLAYYFGNSAIGAKIFGSPSDYAVGASGAIFGIAALFMVLIPKMRFSIVFLPFFSLPGYIMIPFVLFATWIVSSSASFGIGNTAHLGGFLCGIFYGLYLRYKYPKKVSALGRLFV